MVLNYRYLGTQLLLLVLYMGAHVFIRMYSYVMHASIHLHV